MTVGAVAGMPHAGIAGRKRVADYRVLNSGGCGMAGSFRFDRDKSEVSRQIDQLFCCRK
jgi:hypothetical protein